MTFKRLQAEVGEWSDRNFGAQDLINPLLGVIEEIGEICANKVYAAGRDNKTEATDGVLTLMRMMASIGTVAESILKRRQWIGRTRKEHVDREIEALSVLARYAGHRQMRLYDAIDAGRTTREKQAAILEEIDWTVLDDDEREEERNGIADVDIFLADFCHRNSHDREEIVTQVWGDVRDRDWKKNPETGKEVAE